MIKVLILLVVTLSLNAAIITQDVNDANKSEFSAYIPYAVSTESTGLIFGLVGIWSGYGQEQMNIVASGFYGAPTKIKDTLDTSVNAYGLALAINNYKPGLSKRLYMSFLGIYAYYPKQLLYFNGRNDSAQDPLETRGFNTWFNFTFNYVLPFGEYEDKTVITYKLDRGLPVGREDVGGGVPFVSGATTFEVSPFYNKWTADKFTQEPQWSTNGLKFKLIHNNTDFVRSPSRGYAFELKYSNDFASFDSAQSWNAFEASYTQFIELGNASWMRQNVIALNVWSAYSPSWEIDKYIDKQSQINAHRPPPWEGARLGGYDRMRGYPNNRYSDKSAVYYGAEYRFIPNFNPLNKKENTWMPIGIDWFQGVVFVEAGRVAPKYTWENLYTDMKYDVGLSLRALAAKVPVRFDIAYGQEGMNMWFMINQTY